MTTISIPGFIYLKKAYLWDAKVPGLPEGMQPTWATYDPTGIDGILLVIPHTLEFNVPENWDPRPVQVAALREKQAAAAAAFAALTTEINRQINELQALEFTA